VYISIATCLSYSLYGKNRAGEAKGKKLEDFRMFFIALADEMRKNPFFSRGRRGSGESPGSGPQAGEQRGESRRDLSVGKAII
jgi:hypothetical protein